MNESTPLVKDFGLIEASLIFKAKPNIRAPTALNKGNKNKYPVGTDLYGMKYPVAKRMQLTSNAGDDRSLLFRYGSHAARQTPTI